MLYWNACAASIHRGAQSCFRVSLPFWIWARSCVRVKAPPRPMVAGVSLWDSRLSAHKLYLKLLRCNERDSATCRCALASFLERFAACAQRHGE